MTEERILSADDMLSTEDVEYVTVPVPEWKGSVRFGSLDAETTLLFTEASSAPGGQRDATLRLLVRSIVDEKGDRIKNEDVEKFIARFRSKPIKIMNRLMDAVLKLNGMNVKPAEIKNDLGEAMAAASPTAVH